MTSPGLPDAYEGTQDFCFYYELLTQGRRIRPEQEECWTLVATQLAERYDSEPCEQLKLQRVKDQAARNCSLWWQHGERANKTSSI